MNNKKRIIAAVVAVVVIVGGAVWYKLATADTASTPAANTNAPASPAASNDGKPAASTITYDGKTFSVSMPMVAAGSTVKIVNSSASDQLDFDSDPHPVHTDNPELNQGDIAPGTEKTFVLTTKGSWGFHNHLDPTQHGNITVE